MGTDQWTMPELANRVAGALSSGYDGQQNRRVTQVPDQRAIRYYTTLGLLDRPTTMRGRTALYGPRHLWQLVAIKRLQAEGRALADIQHQLAGAPDATLQRLAAIPSEAFWRHIPDAPLTPMMETAVPSQGAYQAVPLDAGVIVLVPRREPLTDRDIAALRTAAGPLRTAISRLTKGQT
jgi:DNA-binding transcriptional MerR regulator